MMKLKLCRARRFTLKKDKDYTVKDVIRYLIVNCACNIVFIVSIYDMHAWHDVRVSSGVL